MHRQVATIRRERERAAVGVDGLPSLRVGEVVDRDVLHQAGLCVDLTGAQIELAFLDGIDDLRTQRERRFRPKDGNLQRRQLVVGARQQLVIEVQHEHRQAHRRDDRRAHQRSGRDAARLERGDLISDASRLNA